MKNRNGLLGEGVSAPIILFIVVIIMGIFGFIAAGEFDIVHPTGSAAGGSLEINIPYSYSPLLNVVYSSKPLRLLDLFLQSYGVSDASVIAGAVGKACTGDSQCDSGLVCTNNLCVQKPVSSSVLTDAIKGLLDKNNNCLILAKTSSDYTDVVKDAHGAGYFFRYTDSVQEVPYSDTQKMYNTYKQLGAISMVHFTSLDKSPGVDLNLAFYHGSCLDE